MSVPHAILAAGWVPFSITVLLVLLFSCVYIKLYQSTHERDVVTALVSVFGLTVALLTCALMPVDIFLVSYMKDSKGHFKVWALNNETRASVVDDVLYTYYVLFGLVTLFIFLLLPLAYFYYEEEDENATVRSRCCTAFKYTLVFIFAGLLLYLVGAFVPFRGLPNPSNNNTNWEEYFKNIMHELGGTQRWEDSISFTMSVLILFGMLNMTLYTGYGISAWPMDLVKGRRSTRREMEDVHESQHDIQAQIDSIRNKYSTSGRHMTTRDRRRLEQLESNLEVSSRQQRHLVVAQRSCMKKCNMLLRPFQIFFGTIFFLFAILVFVSLLLTNIDKILHSAGAKAGYILPEQYLPNPIDITLVFAQRVFPLDYLIMAGIVLYFFYCSMAALKQIGIWFCCIRMYKIRPRRTVPQGLLFLCFLLMFIVLALTVLVSQLAPQYSKYGSQKYIPEGAHHKNGTVTAVPCSTKAPADQCVMTRLSMITTRFCYKFWFFGAAFFYISWAFLAVILIGFVVSVIRKRRSLIEGEVDADDFTDSDDELLMP